jgi:hypothetical protein
LAELDRLQAERAAAEDYDRVRAIDDNTKRAQWWIDQAARKLGELETALAAAKATEQAAALARHKSIIGALYPRLRRALEAAAAVQQEAMAAYDAAVAECGDAAVQIAIQPVAYRGLCHSEFIEIWAAEQDRVWAPKPAPAAPRAVAPAAPARAAPKRAIVAPPAPRPVRPLRQDLAPGEGHAAVIFLRPGAELPDGTPARIGDRCNLPVDQARALIMRGATEYAPAETR